MLRLRAQKRSVDPCHAVKHSLSLASTWFFTPTGAIYPRISAEKTILTQTTAQVTAFHVGHVGRFAILIFQAL
jgi:hypothetical protein